METDDGEHRRAAEEVDGSTARGAGAVDQGACTVRATGAGTIYSVTGYSAGASWTVDFGPNGADASTVRWSVIMPPTMWPNMEWPALKYEDGGIRTGEILAWRSWRVMPKFSILPTDEYNLASAAVPCVWIPGEVIEATPIDYPSPFFQVGPAGYNTDVGIHGWKTRPLAEDYADNCMCEARALGIVRLWGTVYENERGYRAQYARIIKIIGVARADNQFDEWKGGRKLLRYLQKKYEPFA